MRTRHAVLAVTAVTAILYLATLSRHYSGDSIEYALAVELGDPAYLLDPYHPLLHPLGLAFYHLWQLAGWTGQALLPLQALNALAGAVCAGLVAAIAASLTGSAAIAALIGLGFALSGGSWLLSVEAEFVSPPLALLLLVLWALLGASPSLAGRRSYACGLGLATVLAFFSYVSSALLVAVVALGLLLDTRLPRAVRRRQLGLFLATALLAAPLYAGFLALWSGGDWQQVAVQFLGRGSYGRLELFNLPHGVYAFLRSLALYPGLSLAGGTREFLSAQSAAGRAAWAGYYGLILALALLPLALAGRWRRRLWPVQRRPLLVLAAWTALFGAFGFYWVPGDVTFWMPVLAAWWLLVALVIHALAEPDVGARPAPSRQRLLVGLAAGVVALAIANAAFEVLPHRNLSNNHPFWAAQEVIGYTSRDDLVLTRHDDIMGAYVAYFGGRQVGYVSAQSGYLDAILDYAERRGHERVVIADSQETSAGWWREVMGAATHTQAGDWRSGPAVQPLNRALVIELRRP